MSGFASRSGEKLQFALDHFKLSVKDLIIADFGSSTGGFVDCLLQNGAKMVYSIDTSYGELAWKLRKDPRVIVMERTNAMHVNLSEKMDLITIDTSWTRQKNILPNAFTNLKEDGQILSLIKPHYEEGKGKLKEGEAERVLKRVMGEIEELGYIAGNFVESPILGEKGKNREYLCLITKKRT